MNIVFMGTPEFAVPSLQALANNDLAPRLVVTQPSKRRARRGEVELSPVGKAADFLGLELLECEKVSKGAALDQIVEIAPDLIVVVAFGQILRKSLLELPRYGCINLHPSMLPAYRGAAPIQRAIIDGARESGITVMRLVRELDAGPILLQRPFAIEENENAHLALERSAMVGADMLVEVVQAFAAGTPPAELVQDDSLATYAHMLGKDDGLLDFNRPALELHNLVCGVQPWPGAFTTLAGQPLKVHRTQVLSEQGRDAAAGTILAAAAEGLDVACGTGVLRILEVQAESKPRRKIGEFLNGTKLQVGEKLGS
ncbi:MAG: methionyl-tRNA formyltransferase [Planctomycetes bacterium]|nr:methionyl-tRNA formyltransferase [Planctomycetota bacterium]